MLKTGSFLVGTDALTGEATLSIRVPGTFTTIDWKSTTYSGYKLVFGKLWFASHSVGDKITSITIEDPDGVIPVQIRPALPSYPIVKNASDAYSVDSSGSWMPPDGVAQLMNNGSEMLLPSGLYVVLKVKKASAVAENFYVNLIFDDMKG